MTRFEKARSVITAFLFCEESDAWLGTLRIGLGLVVVCYALSLANDWNLLFATSEPALVTRDFSEALLSLQSRFVPRLGWLVDVGQRFGLKEQVVLRIAWICLLGSGLGLTLESIAVAPQSWRGSFISARRGVARLFPMAWMTSPRLVFSISCSHPCRIGLLLIAGDAVRNLEVPQHPVFFHRVLQLHLSLIYFFSGLTKCLGPGWWNGESLWRALTRPPFDVVSADVLVRFKVFFPIAGIGVCLLEVAYPIFIWWKRTRIVWLISHSAYDAAIGLMMGMYLFAMVMIVLNLAAFGVDLLPRLRTPQSSARINAASTAD